MFISIVFIFQRHMKWTSLLFCFFSAPPLFHRIRRKFKIRLVVKGRTASKVWVERGRLDALKSQMAVKLFSEKYGRINKNYIEYNVGQSQRRESFS